MNDKMVKTKLLAITLKLLGYKQMNVVGLSLMYGKALPDGAVDFIKLPLSGLFSPY